MSISRNLFRSGTGPRLGRRRKFYFEKLETRQLLAATLPVLPAVVAPTSNPTLPSGFDVFTPQGTTGSGASGAPAIAQFTQSGGAGDVIAVSLTHPSALPASSNDSDTEFFTYGQTTASNGTLVGDGIEQNNGGMASVDLNSGNTPNSMYFLWAKNADGYSAPVAINKANAWWVGPSQATAGQSVSVYGQDLTFTQTDGLSWVYITQAGSKTGQWATVTSANPYQVTFNVPAGLASGNYQVWVHNGHGGEYGWSSPVTLSVVAPAATSTKIFNVLNYGAVGDGKTDSTSAIQAAINAASAYAGATVYVPTGNYIVGQLNMKANVILMGDGAGKSNILESTKTNAASIYAMLWMAPGDTVENIGLNANGTALQDVVYGRSMSNLNFSGVTMTNMTKWDFDVHADTLVFFTNCNFIGSSNFLGTASQIFFSHDNFYAVNDAEQMLFSYGGSDISITNCTVQDYNNSNPNSGAGWGQGRFFVGNNLWGSQTNSYIGNNTTTALGIRPTASNQNAGEQLLWESTGMLTGGTYVRSTATTVTYKGLPSNLGAGYYAVVTSGDGTGEYVPVKSYNASTGVITLAGSWAATPDSTSVVRVGLIFDNLVVYDNTLQGKGVTNTASAGVQFGAGINCIADSNTILNTRYGVNIWEANTSGYAVPADFDLIQNNSISNVEAGLWIQSDTGGSEVGVGGVVLRTNNISNVTPGFGAIYLPENDTGGAPEYVVLEGNSVTNAPVALLVPTGGTGLSYLTLLNNTFTLGSAAVNGSIALDLSRTVMLTETGDTVSGFGVTDGGSVAPTTLLPTAAVVLSQTTNGTSDTQTSGTTNGASSTTGTTDTSGTSSTGSSGSVSSTTTGTSGASGSTSTGTGSGKTHRRKTTTTSDFAAVTAPASQQDKTGTSNTPDVDATILAS